VVIAAPVYGALTSQPLALFAFGWLYTSGITLVGIGLHPLLGRLTTAAMLTLFVMLNFTTSGGIYDPGLQSPFFAALSQVWNGDAFLEAARGLLYRGGIGVASGALRMAVWAAAGAVLVVAGAWRERRQADSRSAVFIAGDA
jgi:hypothetical protein